MTILPVQSFAWVDVSGIMLDQQLNLKKIKIEDYARLTPQIKSCDAKTMVDDHMLYNRAHINGRDKVFVSWNPIMKVGKNV